jgi:xanthine dehydrogenase YagT iron-sulfur-binding subunit
MVHKLHESINIEGASDDLDRRAFIEGTGVGIAYVSAVPAFAQSRSSAGPTTTVSLTVNGKSHTLAVEDRATLLDVLRDTLGLTGTKKSCDRGECGACTVHINGRRALSCMSLAAMQEDCSITTIEGVARGSVLNPLQAAFIAHDGFQCGFCTSGQIMSGLAVLEEAHAGWPSAATADITQPFTYYDLSETEIRERMSGNLCRCACYPNIVDAIVAVARKG